MSNFIIAANRSRISVLLRQQSIDSNKLASAIPMRTDYDLNVIKDRHDDQSWAQLTIDHLKPISGD